MDIKLHFSKSTVSLPNTERDGKKFLLCWSGWQYEIANWGAERQQFYTANGDYIEGKNPFVYAELPKNLES